MADVRVDGKELSFDELTLGEVEAIEDEFGSWQTLSGVKKTIGAIWQLMRRTNPEYTLEQARGQNATTVYIEDEDPSS